MRILTFTTLYPNAIRPQFGIFVETRLRRLVATGKVEAQVVAPCPWFPSTHPYFGEYASVARVPRREDRGGLIIEHPRYPVIPKLGMNIAPLLLFTAMLPFLKRLIAKGRDFDVIDSHYMYPDGVAAVMLGRALHRPVTVTCRGTDLNRIADYPLPRRQILWAARHASALVTVSQGLRDRLGALGVAPERVRVLRNGVDLELFRPMDQTAARKRLGLEGRVLVSVGNLVPLKGHDLIVDAMRDLPNVTLLVVGRGPERAALATRASRQGLAARVRFIDPVPQEELREIYSAADALILASTTEGWPNVLLEAMACGTPAIATNIPGAAEVISEPAAGQLLSDRSSKAIADTARTVLAASWDRAATRRYAETLGWESTTAGQLDMFEEITRSETPARAHGIVGGASAR